jgi:glycosyltransferase involved in cell wall biosynthesis
VFTTNAAALPEVVDHGQNGFLCPRNDVAAYAARVRELGEDAALRRRFGEHGRAKVVGSFGYHQLAGGLIAVYERLLGH